MKQESEPAVQPRRSLLTALWASLVGLWGSSRLLASTTAAQRAPTSTPAAATKPELTLIIGALCIDGEFRRALFAPGEPLLSGGRVPTEDEKSRILTSAKSLLDQKGLTHERTDVKETLDRILLARRESLNPVQKACASVERAIGGISREACKRYPC